MLGSAGPTDATGKVTLSVSPYSGPVQIVAGGPAVTYADPTAAAGQNGVGPVIQVPSSFLFTSFIAKFKPGTPVPLTFLTTLADRAALAFAHGLHPSHPSKATISEALAARDPLFVTHITNAPAAWSPGALRWTMPAPLHSAPQSLVDAAFAALFDVALNQLARDTAAQAGYGDDGRAHRANPHATPPGRHRRRRPARRPHVRREDGIHGWLDPGGHGRAVPPQAARRGAPRLGPEHGGQQERDLGRRPGERPRLQDHRRGYVRPVRAHPDRSRSIPWTGLLPP